MTDKFNNRWNDEDDDHKKDQSQNDSQNDQNNNNNDENDHNHDYNDSDWDDMIGFFGNDKNGRPKTHLTYGGIPIPPNYARVENVAGDFHIAKVGFSWTTLMFGPLVPIFRGDWYNFFLMLVLDMDYILVALFFKLNWLLQFPWPSIFFSIFYNMMYFRHLFNLGYAPVDSHSKKLLSSSHYLPKRMR